MTAHSLSTILLIEDPSSPETRLRDILHRSRLRAIGVGPGSDFTESVTKTRPALLLVGAGAARAFLEQVDPVVLSTGPGALVLTSPRGKTARGDSRIDYLDPDTDDDVLLARIHWHLRLRRLESESERLREEMENLRRSASIGAVADSVTHNLNNVLGIIFGYMHLLKMNHDKPDRVLKHHASLEQAIAKMTEMVRRFGEAARETQPEPEPTAVKELLRCAVRRFQQENRVAQDFPFSVDPPDLMVTTCFSRAEDALAGLIKNAWESYGEAPATQRPIEISATAGPERVIIRIRDQGAGLDPEIEPTMFEPFTGTKATDGLGLAIARRCFRNLGGDLFLKNVESGGAIAEVHHPR